MGLHQKLLDDEFLNEKVDEGINLGFIPTTLPLSWLLANYQFYFVNSL